MVPNIISVFLFCFSTCRTSVGLRFWEPVWSCSFLAGLVTILRCCFCQRIIKSRPLTTTGITSLIRWAFLLEANWKRCIPVTVSLSSSDVLLKGWSSEWAGRQRIHHIRSCSFHLGAAAYQSAHPHLQSSPASTGEGAIFIWLICYCWKLLRQNDFLIEFFI